MLFEMIFEKETKIHLVRPDLYVTTAAMQIIRWSNYSVHSIINRTWRTW